MGSRPNVIVEGQKPDGNYIPLKTNSSGELIVAGSVGGGSGAVQITDGTQSATITDVAGKKALDVNVTNITLNHQDDSVSIGDGTRTATITQVGAKNALDVNSLTKVYAKRIDEPNANTIYIGKALPGSDPSDSVWQIKRIVFSGNLTTESYPDGSDLFNKSWNDRAILTYS